MALAFAPLEDSIRTKFLRPTVKGRIVCSEVIVHGNSSIIKKSTKIGFLIYAVSLSFSDGVVMSNLHVFLYYPCEVSVNFGGVQVVVPFRVCGRPDNRL